MKTFDEILLEIIEDDYRHHVETKESPETRAAKEYAKQWVDFVCRQVVDAVPVSTSIDYFTNLIDEQ